MSQMRLFNSPELIADLRGSLHYSLRHCDNNVIILRVCYFMFSVRFTSSSQDIWMIAYFCALEDEESSNIQPDDCPPSPEKTFSCLVSCVDEDQGCVNECSMYSVLAWLTGLLGSFASKIVIVCSFFPCLSGFLQVLCFFSHKHKICFEKSMQLI